MIYELVSLAMAICRYAAREAIAQSRILLELLQYFIWILWYKLLAFKFFLQYSAQAHRLCISSVQVANTNLKFPIYPIGY